MFKYLLDTNIVIYVMKKRPIEVMGMFNQNANLEKAGQTIGVNDLHIAAHARSEGLVLVTNNTHEFVRVPGLLVENWVNG